MRIFSDLPASMKFICCVFSSKSVTPIWSSRFSKPSITAFDKVPPFVSKVSCTLPFFSTICWLVPESAEKNKAVESARAASAFAFCAASFSFCCLAALSLMAAAILSCFRAASISSADGWLYQLNPIRTNAMRTKPMIVSLFIYLLLFVYIRDKSRCKITKKMGILCNL